MKDKSVRIRARPGEPAGAGTASGPRFAVAAKQSRNDAGLTTSRAERSSPVLAGVGAAALGPNLQSHIGRQLRAAFQQVVDEAVPDRFVALIESLSKKQDG